MIWFHSKSTCLNIVILNHHFFNIACIAILKKKSWRHHAIFLVFDAGFLLWFNTLRILSLSLKFNITRLCLDVCCFYYFFLEYSSFLQFVHSIHETFFCFQSLNTFSIPFVRKYISGSQSSLHWIDCLCLSSMSITFHLIP